MAKGVFTRLVALVFDRDAAQRMESETKESLGRAGQRGSEEFEAKMEEGGRQASRALVAALTQEFNATIAQAKINLAKGLIDPAQFKEIENQARRTFNDALLKGHDQLQAKGKTTDAQLQSLAMRLKQVGTAGEEGTSRAGKAMDWLKGRALALGGALAAAFAVRKIVEFGKDSIATFTEAEGVWSRLDGALQNAGVSFAEVRGEIEANARAMQDATKVGDEDYAAVLTELVQMSGDYAASIENVQIVADLAAAKQIDLQTAAQLVGKAMIGETSTLKRYGIVVADGADAVAVMREQFRGMAEREGQTLGGQIARLNNEWGDFKEAVGGAMVEAGGGASVLDTLIGVMKGLATWTAENKTQIAAFGSGAIKLTTGFVLGLYRAVVSLGNGFSGVLLTAVSMVTKGYTGLVWATGAAVRATAWLNDVLGRDDAAAKWEARADAIDQNVAALRRYSAEADAQARRSFQVMRDPAGTGSSGSPAASPGRSPVPVTPRTPRLGSGSSGIEGVTVTATGQVRLPSGVLAPPAAGAMAGPVAMPGIDSGELERAQAFFDEWGPMAQDAGAEISEAFGDSFELLFTDIRNIDEAFSALWKGVAKGVLGAVANEASQRAAINFMKAAEAGAMALFYGLTGNPAAAGFLRSAAQFTATATGYAALAGAGGAVMGGMSGGGGGASHSGGRDPGLRTASQAAPPPTEVTINVNPWDPANPLMQDSVYAAYQPAAERWGTNARVTTRPYPRGGG